MKPAASHEQFATQMAALANVTGRVRCEFSGRSISCAPQCASCRRARERMDDAGWTQCPHCGDWVETMVAVSGDVILAAHAWSPPMDAHEASELEADYRAERRVS